MNSLNIKTELEVLWGVLVQVEPATKVRTPFERVEKLVDSGIGLPDK